MKKLINLFIIFFLFSTNSYTASEIEETTKNLLKSISKKSLKKEETKIFISNYALTLDDGRGDGVVTYIFDERIYKRYKDSKVLSEGDWRFSKLGALRLFLGDIKLTWKIKLKTKKTQDLILIKTKFSPTGKLYPFTYQKKEEFLASNTSIILDEKKNNQSTVKKEEEKKIVEKPKKQEPSSSETQDWDYVNILLAYELAMTYQKGKTDLSKRYAGTDHAMQFYSDGTVKDINKQNSNRKTWKRESSNDSGLFRITNYTPKGPVEQNFQINFDNMSGNLYGTSVAGVNYNLPFKITNPKINQIKDKKIVKVKPKSSQENNNETLKNLSEENNKNNVVAECESKIKKKWEDILELKDYSLPPGEQKKRRQNKIDKEINACIEINTQEVEVATIPNELVVKKNGFTYIKGNPAAFDTSPLEICDETAPIWNNCKAAYEMSTAPPQIYNNLVDPKNVSIYRGEFKDNFPHGSGTLQFNDGTFTYVLFDNGQLKELTNYEGARAYQVKKYMEILKKNKKNSFQPKPGYEICRSSWKQLITIRNSFAKNNPNYYRVDALVQTAFDLMQAFKGTNAKDTGNCEKLVSLAN